MKYVEHEESSNPAFVRESTVEFSNDSYKGQAVIARTSTAPQVNTLTGNGVISGGVNRSFLRVTSTGIERVAHTYRSSSTISGNLFESGSDSTFLPLDSMRADLRPGETHSWDYTETRTYWSTSSPTPTTKDYRWVGRTEFLGFEDVTLADGTVIKNACKLKRKDLGKGETTAYTLYWVAAGLSGIKSESYTTTGGLFDKSIINKILVAP